MTSSRTVKLERQVGPHRKMLKRSPPIFRCQQELPCTQRRADETRVAYRPGIGRERITGWQFVCHPMKDFRSR